MDAMAIANMFAQLDRELWLVTSASGERSGGLIATFVSQASIVPEIPRVLLGIAKQHHTWSLIETSSTFALHLLSEEQLEWVWRFSLQSGRVVDKLAGLAVRPGMTGSPILLEALGYLECRVEARYDSGDRTAYLAEVLDGGIMRPGPVLTMKRLLQVAPAEKLTAMKESYVRDGTVDAEAIQAWRLRARTGVVSNGSVIE